MQKTFALFSILTLLAGCSGTRKSDSGDIISRNSEGGLVAGTPPPFALPGVPLRNDLPAPQPRTDLPGVPPRTDLPGFDPEEKSAVAPAAPAEEVRPAAAVSADQGGELEFHLASAAKYAAGKKYRSAAAEYGAALGLLPAGDARAVNLLERQGAMQLRAGNETKAREFFLSAIGKAKELGTSGVYLSNSYLGLGYCQEKTGKIPDAIASYEKALEFSTNKTMKARIAKTISDLKNAPK